MYSRIYQEVIMFLKFKFARNVVKPITGNFKSGAYARERMAADIQSAAATPFTNPSSVTNLIESYETGLMAMQDVVADLREIVDSIDTVLEKIEAID